MITSLTDQQREQLAVYRDRGLAMGLSTEQASDEQIRAAVRLFDVEIMGRRDDLPILILPSPLSAWWAYLAVEQAVRQDVGQAVRQDVEQDVEQAVWQAVEQAVWQAVWQAVRQDVGQAVWQDVGQAVGQDVWQDVGQAVRQDVRQAVEQAVEQAVRQDVWFAWPYWDGHWWSSYIAWASYYRDVLGLELPAAFSAMEAGMCYGVYYPSERASIVSRKPTLIKRNAGGQLHCANGPALTFGDGFSIWVLNRVTVSRWWIETPTTKWDVAAVLAETNVDVRRELIRLAGIDRLLAHLPYRVLDTEGNYQLLAVDLSEEVQGFPLLRMPSIAEPGVWHLEWVARECRTVQEAHNWRARRDISRLWSPQSKT